MSPTNIAKMNEHYLTTPALRNRICPQEAKFEFLYCLTMPGLSMDIQCHP